MRYLLPTILLLAVAIGGVGSESARTAPLSATSASVLSPVQAVNELIATPWEDKAKQQAQDAVRNLRESLEDKRLVDEDGSKNGFKWDFSLRLDDVKASVDLSSPPAFTRASASGFALEVPRGSGWDFALSGDVEGNAWVKLAGEKLFSWSPGFHFGLRIKDFKIVAETALDNTRPNRPKVRSSTIRPRLTLVGDGFLPVSIPISFTARTVGEKIELRGRMTAINLKEALGALDAKLTADLVITILPRGQLDLSPVEPGPFDVDFDEIPLGKGFRTVKVEWSGSLKVGLKKVGRLTLPFRGFDLSIPFPSSQGLNEALAQLRGPQPWGDAKQAPHGAVPDPAAISAPLVEIEAGAAKHMPHGAALSFDFIAGRGGEPFSTYTYGGDEDSAIWTGHYLAAESFRYAATQDAEALTRVKAAVEGLRRLFWVTSDAVETIEDGKKVLAPVAGVKGVKGAGLSERSGILARTAKPDSDSRGFTRKSSANEGGPLETRRCHYVKPEGGWEVRQRGARSATTYKSLAAVPAASRALARPLGPVWYGWGCSDNHPVSKDQYIGAMMGLALAWKLVPDAEVRQVAGQLLEDALDYVVLDNDWNVRLPPDGRIQTDFLGDFPKQLAFLRIGKTVNPAKYGALYDKLAPAAELAWIPVWANSFDPIHQYYKFNLSHAAFIVGLVLEDNAGQRQRWHDSYLRLWGPVAHHKNAYFGLARILAEPEDGRLFVRGGPSQSNADVTLEQEVLIVLGEWVRRWTVVKGPNGVPLHKVGDAGHQLRLWPSDIGKFKLIDGRTFCLARYALAADGRPGSDKDFMWQRDPFRVSVSEAGCKSSPRPDTEQLLRIDAKRGNRESPGIDYLLAYWLAVYLGVLPGSSAPPPPPAPPPAPPPPSPPPPAPQPPAQKKLVATKLSTTPKTPIAGKPLTATLKVRTAAGNAVRSARVTCSAKAGTTKLRLLTKRFRASTASCAWRLPQATSRKRLTGTVKVQSGTASVTKRFVRRIRPPTDL